MAGYAIAGLFAALLTLAPPAAADDAAAPLRILAFGDSLTAGYGLGPGDGFPDRLEAALKAKGFDVKLINGGVSGDTTAGGRARLGWALSEPVDLVILELGANDGLRGIDPADTYANLDAMLDMLGRRNIPVLLTGMYAPPNMGDAYGRQFNAVFPALAAKHQVAFYPFFLDGVAAERALNQPDGIHPNRRGIDVIVDRILPHVVRLLRNNYKDRLGQ